MRKKTYPQNSPNAFSPQGNQPDKNTFNPGFSSAPSTSPFAPSTPARPQGYHGNWLVSLTVITLLSAIVSAFLIQFIDTLLPSDRSSMVQMLMDILYFSSPIFSVLFGACMVEKCTSAMTPRFSRAVQMTIPFISSSVMAIVVLICSLCYQHALAPKPAVTEQVISTPDSQQIIILLDKSGSMNSVDDANNIHAIQTLLSRMSPDSQVGFLIFTGHVNPNDIVSMGPLDSNQKSKIDSIIYTAPSGGTNFTTAFGAALDMLEAAPNNLIHNRTTFFILTDGYDDITESNRKLILSRCRQLNVEINCINLDTQNFTLQELITSTGGTYVSLSNTDDLIQETTKLIQIPSSVPAEPEKPITLHNDPVYPRILYVLQGIILGVSLFLMLSVQGQIRVQTFLSIFVGILCCLPYGKLFSSFMGDNAMKLQLLINSILPGFVFMRRNRPPHSKMAVNVSSNQNNFSSPNNPFS